MKSRRGAPMPRRLFCFRGGRSEAARYWLIVVGYSEDATAKDRRSKPPTPNPFGKARAQANMERRTVAARDSARGLTVSKRRTSNIELSEAPDVTGQT